jgi:hypothetical protein
MAGERAKLRGIILTEDRRTERFIRLLLTTLGYNKALFRYETAPRGAGAGEAWVLRRYAGEVKVLRAKNFQRLCLIAVRDGDSVGVDARKTELDEALRQAGLDTRQPHERIAAPVPTWAIENWLLDLLEHAEINEDKGPDSARTWKQVFERMYGREETRVLTNAAQAWTSTETSLPSRGDGRVELARIDQ